METYFVALLLLAVIHYIDGKALPPPLSVEANTSFDQMSVEYLPNDHILFKRSVQNASGQGEISNQISPTAEGPQIKHDTKGGINQAVYGVEHAQKRYKRDWQKVKDYAKNNKGKTALMAVGGTAAVLGLSTLIGSQIQNAQIPQGFGVPNMGGWVPNVGGWVPNCVPPWC